MKAQKTHTYVLKLHSSLLAGKKWDYKTSISAIRNDHGSVVSLNDSQVIRWFEKINGTERSDEEAKQLKEDIKWLKKQPSTKKNKDCITKKYDELYKKRFLSDYMMVVFDKKSHYDRARRGFSITIDGVKINYRYFIGTAGSIKKGTIIFVNESKYYELMWHMNNGRDMTKSLVPSKLEAYMALACSGSIPLSEFPRIAVVNDCISHPIIKEVLHIDYTDYSVIEPVVKVGHNEQIEMNGSDGFGLMTPEFSRRVNIQLGGDPDRCVTFNTRCAFTKGMLVPFDFVDFADKVAGGNYIIRDAWGNNVDVRNLDCILTVSMLKLWDSYKSCDDYVQNCKEHDFQFCVAKTAPYKLDDRQTSNYQFIQGYTNLTDDDISQLVEPTVHQLKDCLGMDWRKLLLYMCGKGLDEKTYQYADVVARAIMICPDIVNDKFIRSRIAKMIAKSVREAKMGKLQLRGNFQIITGDPYCLAQSIFGIEDADNVSDSAGLLFDGEAYSKYWVDRGVDKVVAFRAPMLTHNNTALLNIVHNENIDYWYKYITDTIILNNHSDICMRECGCDYDSDTFMTTDNQVLVNKYRLLPVIDCAASKSQKVALYHKDAFTTKDYKPNKEQKKIERAAEECFAKSEKRAFSDRIGGITNIGTSQLNLQAKYTPNDPEYYELEKRVNCCMLFQQAAIDMIKTGVFREPPKHWNSISANEANDEFNRSLVARKPYFFIYNYDYVNSDYKKYIKNANANAKLRFGKDVASLLDANSLSDEENVFIHNYHKYLPIDYSPGTVNRICWNIENEFKTLDVLPNVTFDYHVLTSDSVYTMADFHAIEQIYYEYIEAVRDIKMRYTQIEDNLSEENMCEDIDLAKESFKEHCLSLCNNEKALTNILIELCYNSDGSKFMVWDMFGEQIIENLLHKFGKYTFPIKSDGGDIVFDGECFELREVVV